MAGRKARILVIGSEIVNGYITDTNAGFFARELYAMGLEVAEIRAIPDDESVMLSTLRELAPGGDLIITTGGLGPTEDDKTVDVISEYLGVEPVFDPASAEKIKSIVGDYNRRNRVLPENREAHMARLMRQGRIPAGTQAIENPAGLAPGIFIPEIPLLAFPGFPLEIEALWPEAKKRMEGLSMSNKLARVVPLWGVSEGLLFETITPPPGVEMGVHALPWGSRLFFRADEKHENALNEVEERLKRSFDGHIMENPVKSWSDWLLKQGKTFGTVESCTGGLGGKLITDISGVSGCYEGSIVSYSNEIKSNLLGVSCETIEKHGAVSAQTASEMVFYGLQKLNCDYCFSITGVAGPGGGTLQKPVGSVYIAIGKKPGDDIVVARFYFPFSRERFRNAAIYTAYLSIYLRYCRPSKEWASSLLGAHFSGSDVSEDYSEG